MSAQIELLTALSTQPFPACEAQWFELLHSLFLPVAYIPAIQAVLEKGRWKSQPDPMAYVRKSSLRSAVRLGIVDVRRNRRHETLASDLQLKDSDGKSLGHDDRLGTALHRYDEQSGAGFGGGLASGYGDIYDEDYIGNRLPESVLDNNLEVKWDRVADMAQMDSGERIVLRLRLLGLEREAALATCYTDDDRKILQAAWKRFDRHKELFKEVLMSGEPMPRQRSQLVGSSQAVQENRANQTNPASGSPGATPQLEMIFIELPQGGMKISFRKCVAEK